jgi:hypothetical protein
MTTYTINTLPVEYANKIVCAFCSQYANENYCVPCNEYKGLMTLAEFMTTYEISEWVEDEQDALATRLDNLIAKGVYA